MDGNLLVYAHISDYPQHPETRAWLDERLNGPGRVGLPWPSLLAFLRLVTNPRIFVSPESMQAAWAQITDWLDREAAWVPTPTHRHGEVLGPLLEGHVGKSNLVPDAHLAALAIEHGLVLCSSDGDFARFPGLRRENPLAVDI